MEEIYMNAEYDKFNSAKNCTGPRKYKRSFHTGVILCLGLLSFFLLIGLITLGVYFRDSARDVSAISSKLSSMTEERDLLQANLSTTRNKLSSMTEERDLLQANLTVKTNELERFQDKTCPVGWSKFNHRCYLLSERSDSWDAARKNCTDEEADLLVIDSPEEKTFLSTIINEHTWIGLNDKEQEGTWKWVDGTPPTLMHWASSQPDNGGDEDCACFRSHATNSWMDFPCSAFFQWICEKTPNSQNTCSEGWSKFNCSCYVRSQSSGSWDAARKDCRDRGADLVVVDSPEEQIFLSAIATEITWIGLNEKKQEGTWKWVDGTPLTLSYWGWTEPNNGGEEDCAHIYSSEDMSMNDLSCSTSLKWICEKAPNYCIVF